MTRKTKGQQPPRDELCYCGHLKSQHKDTIVPGHGPCVANQCGCRKFTWKEFVK